MVNGAASDNRASLYGVIAIVTLAIKDLIDELFEPVGVGDFLQENDVWRKVAYCCGRVDRRGTV